MTACAGRIGLFGGAFDPPHRAHHALAEAAIAQLQLDLLVVLPTGDAWHKQRTLTAAAHRIAMARLAFADLPRAKVDARETLRQGPSYTVDTLRELHGEHPRAAFFLVIGQDQAGALHSWHEWPAIVQLAIICVAAREDSAGTAVQFAPPQGLEQRFLPLLFPHLRVSATDIRSRVASGQVVDTLVGRAVARYIADHHLYRST